jgi:hypothetical protein
MDRDDREANRNESSPTDSAASVRLGCGALIGVVLGVPLALSAMISGFGMLAAAEVVACVMVCAILSRRFGDRFYETLAKWWTWL